MAKKKQKSATCGPTLEGLVRCGEKNREFQAVVYEEYSGWALRVTFLGDKWWVTTQGEALQPLEDYFGGEPTEYTFLCEAGGKVGALALAQMLGKSLELPECDVDVVLRRRCESLRRLGVTLDVEDEALTLELRVFENPKDSYRKGKISVWCYAVGNCNEELFDVDGFESKKDAEEWATCYFDFLERLGMKFTII